ncbi:MAG: biotin--[acetyl-CoA-carboxylase] ligase [Acidobacteriota bacterium]
MIDTSIVRSLTAIESIAVIPRVASTNLIARRIVVECIENELSLPQAMIIAGEQFAGRGRNDRHWSSPAGKGIYATTLVSRPAQELQVLPLAIANVVATYLRDTFGLDARIKWPNDVLVGGKKIAGILIEARVHEDRAYVLIGTGINVEPVEDGARPNAISISELAPDRYGGLEAATRAFIESIDAHLSHPFVRDTVLTRWRELSVHQPGDRIHCVLGERTVDGTWSHLDEYGRAVLDSDSGTIAVSAGDLFLA